MSLNAAYSYCKKWKLTVNVDKTKIVIFSRGRVTKHFDFTFNGERVDVVDEYIYLGVLFNYNGLYAKAISKQISQARKAMFSLLTKARRLLLPIDVVIDLFDKCVVPILLYGCEIWGHTDLDKIEIFYRKFIKIALNVGTYCSSSKIYGEVGKLPLKHTIEKRIVGFWIKTSDDKPQKYSTLIYKLLFTLHASEQFHFKWLDNIENILTKCGFKNLFIEQEEYLSKKPFKKLIFKEITKEGQMEWYHNMFIKKTVMCIG